MTSYQPGTQIRVPATANLMIDSTDATRGLPDDFVIQKKNSILNGFFTRIAATELVVDWGLPNISQTLENVTFSVSITGGSEVYVVTVPSGNYTVKTVLDTLVFLLNAAQGLTIFSVNANLGKVYLTAGVAYIINPTKLATQLGLSLALSKDHLITNPDLRPYTYLDFVSDSLTYNQALKDATTTSADKNVLVRFYFALDNSFGTTQLDGYGFPILLGYTTFVLRRPYNYPKQISWNREQPLGQLSFQVYGSDDRLISATYGAETSLLEWLCTLQVSEN
jgi:hypothetical protein